MFQFCDDHDERVARDTHRPACSLDGRPVTPAAPARRHPSGARRHAHPRRRSTSRSNRGRAGSSSGRTGAARRHCCASPRCTNTRRPGRSMSSASASVAPTCASSVVASRSCPPPWPTASARRSPPTTSCAPPASPRSSRGGTRYSAADDERATECLARMGVEWLGGPRVRHAVVGRAHPRPARPIADERAGDRAPRRAGHRARPGRPRAVGGRPLRARRRSRVTAVRHGQPPRGRRADQPHPRPAAARRTDARQLASSTRCSPRRR